MDKHVKLIVNIAIAIIVLGALIAITEPKAEPIILHAGTYCEWYDPSRGSGCNSSVCYANKATADKVCIDISYKQAMSYTYAIDSDNSATKWNGSAWVAASADSTDAGPQGGGGVAVASGGRDTSTIYYVYCC